MEYWPTTIPQRPLQNGARITLPDNRRVTTMDAGPGKVRLKATTAPYSEPCNYAMTKAQLDYFKSFYVTTTHCGTDFFYWPDWSQSDNDAAPVYVQARFSLESDPPSAVPNESEFIVSVVLEVWR